MTIPFHPTSTNELPVSIIDFLPSAALAQFSRVNKCMHRRVDEELKRRKKAVVDPLIYYFYYSDEQRYISIRKHTSHYDTVYYEYVRRLFRCLPELFHFIEINKVTHLDLGCVMTGYGGVPESPYRMISSDYYVLLAIAKEILDLLSKNKTILTCNLGFFQHIIGRKSIIEAVEKHPVLDWLSMLSSGARSDFGAAPYTLYRNRRDRSFYWDHGRHDDGLKSDVAV